MGPEGVGASTALDGSPGRVWAQKSRGGELEPPLLLTSHLEKSICMTNFTEQMSLTAQKYLCDPVGLKKLSGNFFESESKTL